MSDTTNIYQALLAAQKAMPAIGKNAINPHFKFAYADLGQVLNTITPALHEHGLLVVQRLDYDHESLAPVLLTEVIYAATGEKLASAIPIACKDPSDPQKVGGAITYYRRYSLLALLGLSPEDDDANSAAQPPTRPSAAQRPPEPRSAAQAPARAFRTAAEIDADLKRVKEEEGIDTTPMTTADVNAVLTTAQRMVEKGSTSAAVLSHLRSFRDRMDKDQREATNGAWLSLKADIEARDRAIEARGEVLA